MPGVFPLYLLRAEYNAWKEMGFLGTGEDAYKRTLNCLNLSGL